MFPLRIVFKGTNMLTKDDWNNAIASQNACNSLALINSLSDVGPRIREEVQSSHGFNNHPIVQMYLVQLCHLASGSFEPCDYSNLFQLCNLKSKEPLEWWTSLSVQEQEHIRIRYNTKNDVDQIVQTLYDNEIQRLTDKVL
jgi:uncharacterized membrane protein YheB (UPF0754 family)